MKKINQQNIRIFHILGENSDDELLGFLKKSLPLFKGYLLVFDNLSAAVKDFLDSSDVDYIKNKHLSFIDNKEEIANILKQINKESKIINPQESIKQDSALSNENLSSTKSKFITRLVRSGESIVNSGDILVFNRVNSGAMLTSQSNICIFGECNGDVQCDGEFLILSKITKGKVTFQGDIITANMLKYKLNLIYKDNDELNIKDILSL